MTGLRLEPTNAGDDGSTYVIRPDGRMSISVSQEQAVDCHNQMFECTTILTRDDAIKLRDWLNEHFK